MLYLRLQSDLATRKQLRHFCGRRASARGGFPVHGRLIEHVGVLRSARHADHFGVS